jgi:hypothetical protein
MLIRAEAYQRRSEVAEQVLRRRGVDPDSAEYQAASSSGPDDVSDRVSGSMSGST